MSIFRWLIVLYGCCRLTFVSRDQEGSCMILCLLLVVGVRSLVFMICRLR